MANQTNLNHNLSDEDVALLVACLRAAEGGVLRIDYERLATLFPPETKRTALHQKVSRLQRKAGVKIGGVGRVAKKGKKGKRKAEGKAKEKEVEGEEEWEDDDGGDGDGPPTITKNPRLDEDDDDDMANGGSSGAAAPAVTTTVAATA